MRRALKDVSLTLLCAVITVVSVAALVKTVASPFQGGSFGVAQWALFAVTVAGATLALVRSTRYWASLSLLARLRPVTSDSATEPFERASPERRMHPTLDDLTWGALALAVVAINVLAVWAVVVTVGDLLGDSETAAGWLLWQLALLTAAATALARLGAAVAAELRDRSLRRRRNAVHVVTGKLLNSPGESSSAGRRARQVAAVAATALLALVSWASASGPLLEPAQDRESGAQLAKRIGEGRSAAQGSHGVEAQAAAAQAAGLPGAGESARKRSRRARGSKRSSRGLGAADQPTVAPVPPAASPPSVVTPAPPHPRPDTTRPTQRAKERAARERRRRQAEERRRSAPTRPPPTATQPVTPPAPTTPTPSPQAPPCDPAGDPALQPPCGGAWQGGPPPE